MVKKEIVAGPGKSLKIKKRKPRVERYLKSIEPLIIENTKKVLVMKGHRTSETICEVLRDLARLAKPHAVVMTRKNDVLPFEDVNSLEFLASKNDCSLVALGSHTKKRPNNLILSRMYDGHVLDLAELGVEKFMSIESITGPKKAVSSKPLMTFLGDQWDNDTTYRKLQNLLIDYFRGDKTDHLSLRGIDNVIVCTAIDNKILIYTYFIRLLKSGTRIPAVELVPMGPNMNLVLRRTQFASDDLMKHACKQPKTAKKPKVKNIRESSMGDKIGRIHMMPQNLDKMGTRRMSALRNKKKAPEENANATVEKAGKTTRKDDSSKDESSGKRRKKNMD
mmetsp:Transcript_34622/g.35308  ORF Transcript_34622/g.35308 Transcript_34622/m.35308 type:complete len:335 (+) Transcript_34622:102-1106(+)